MAIVGYGGKVTSYDLAVGVKINMDELIYMISPVDSPLINGVGTDGRQLLGSSPVDQTTFKWMDEELLLPSAPASAVNSATGASVTTVTVSAANSYKFQVGDLLSYLISSDYLPYVIERDSLDLDQNLKSLLQSVYNPHPRDEFCGLAALKGIVGEEYSFCEIPMIGHPILNISQLLYGLVLWLRIAQHFLCIDQYMLIPHCISFLLLGLQCIESRKQLSAMV